ncbi:uncharacterized protein BDCG_05170 [Blastomyces dermatitidis ER-3]|uniref:Uncharacterized protein n=2 Tax=Blastomyces TaxID=229219 RepID=A0A179UZC5_BLAGS|nr:uncharacterized protein BDBG_07822 [Blastomyces gilchristii SLH14081]XP_045276858.1 uncharacterized protein BDCG_05170 [Blastomyces dermatitidis ER-3]EEQ90050.2 hypothetical protein BDCG_05170 [Blastomyces dermatitidis ER-3]OAT12488.1 hypothetical protein BDBG_07822 [Blastomyces gilchristii SLH14081]
MPDILLLAPEKTLNGHILTTSGRKLCCKHGCQVHVGHVEDLSPLQSLAFPQKGSEQSNHELSATDNLGTASPLSGLVLFAHENPIVAGFADDVMSLGNRPFPQFYLIPLGLWLLESPPPPTATVPDLLGVPDARTVPRQKCSPT